MTETKKWIDRSSAEDIAHEKRQEDERIDAWFNHPSYWREIEELEAARRASDLPELPDGLEYVTDPFSRDGHLKSSIIPRRREQRQRGNEDDWTR